MTTTIADRTIAFGRPMISDAERAAVAEVLDGPILTHGPRVRGFEEDFAAFTGAAHALALGSCTAGLHLAWWALGIGAGDEVIVPAQTHIATAHAVELAGARCVFVDVEPRTGNLDLDRVEAAITPRTRGIAVVHYLGQPVDMDRTMSIARSHGLAVVEDCALAVGASWKDIHVGLHGDAGCFSFYPVKHITTGEGGMLITNRADVAERVGLQRAFGIDRNDPTTRLGAGYDVVTLGNNYRMNEIAAAMGRVQMGRLPGFLEHRERNYRVLHERLAGLDHTATLDFEHDDHVHGYYCYPLILNGLASPLQSAIIAGLRDRGVGASVYYPRPVPAMTYYTETRGSADEGFPVAAGLSASSIALPVGPHLDEADVRRVAGVVEEVVHELTA